MTTDSCENGAVTLLRINVSVADTKRDTMLNIACCFSDGLWLGFWFGLDSVFG